jgi:hypothetical protein
MAMTMDACVAMEIIGALLESESRMVSRMQVWRQVLFGSEVPGVRSPAQPINANPR